MAGSTYSTNLKIELMTTGENSGTWGDITNTNLGTALEQAIVGYGNPDYVSDANLTISITNSNAAQAARALVLNVTSVFGSLTQTRELVVPTIQKQYIVQNNTTGGQSITVKTSAGTGITVPNGRKAHLYVDGTNVIQMFDYVDINGGSIDGTPIGASSASTGAFTTLNASGATTLDGNVTLGNASGDTVTVTGTISSNLLFTDNTYDIGASGATRPRNLYLAGAATIGGNLSVGGTLTLTGGLTLNGNVTVGDSAADTLTINSTVTSNLLFTDNTYDIGASGATRPRNLFLAGNATIGGNQTLTGSLTVDSTTDTSSATTGSIQTDGGVGIAKGLYVGGNTTLGDASADTVTMNGTVTSNLIFTDNTYDIGASGATRPRNIYVSNNITLDNQIGIGVAPTGNRNITMQTPASGQAMWIVNDATYNYGQIYFGGTANGGYQAIRADGRNTGYISLLTNDTPRLTVDISGNVTLSSINTANRIPYVGSSNYLVSSTSFLFNGTTLLLNGALTNSGFPMIVQGKASTGYTIGMVNDATLNYSQMYFGYDAGGGTFGALTYIRADGRTSGYMKFATSDVVRAGVTDTGFFVGDGGTAQSGQLNVYRAAGTNAPTTVTVANSYLHLGNWDYGPSNNGKFMIAFGYTGNNTNAPAYIGYEEVNTSAATNGALTFYTRPTATDVAPTKRGTISETGAWIIPVSTSNTNFQIGGYSGSAASTSGLGVYGNSEFQNNLNVGNRLNINSTDSTSGIRLYVGQGIGFISNTSSGASNQFVLNSTGANYVAFYDLYSRNGIGIGRTGSITSTPGTTMLCLDASNDRVGVGTVTPSQKFEVAGMGYFVNTGLRTVAVTASGCIQQDNGPGSAYIFGKGAYDNTLARFDFCYGSGNLPMLSLTSNNNVVIGINAGATELGTMSGALVGFTGSSATAYNASPIVWGSYSSAGGIPNWIGNWPAGGYGSIGPDTGSADSTLRAGIASSNANGWYWTGYANFKAASFPTSSDYRLKENIRDYDVDAIELVKQLKPKLFNLKKPDHPDYADDLVVDELGYLAHDIKAIVPQVAIGEKDEVDAQGNPVYQSVKYDRLASVVVALALKQLIEKFEAYVASHP